MRLFLAQVTIFNLQNTLKIYKFVKLHFRFFIQVDHIFNYCVYSCVCFFIIPYWEELCIGGQLRSHKTWFKIMCFRYTLKTCWWPWAVFSSLSGSCLFDTLSVFIINSTNKPWKKTRVLKWTEDNYPLQ